MRVPVNERVKDAPASALRAMFAGLGSLLAVTDKIRPKHAAPEAAAEPEVPAAGAAVAVETVAVETVAEPAPAASAGVTAVSEAPAEPEAAAASPAEPAAVAEPATSAAPEAAPAALPIANYDELSVASLRARLRNLSVEQLAELVAYEKGHAARGDVITMFERRIAKVESEA
jgi:hypothetical protein